MRNHTFLVLESENLTMIKRVMILFITVFAVFKLLERYDPDTVFLRNSRNRAMRKLLRVN